MKEEDLVTWRSRAGARGPFNYRIAARTLSLSCIKQAGRGTAVPRTPYRSSATVPHKVCNVPAPTRYSHCVQKPTHKM